MQSSTNGSSIVSDSNAVIQVVLFQGYHYSMNLFVCLLCHKEVFIV